MKKLKVFTLIALALPLCAFAENADEKADKRPEVSFSQRHSSRSMHGKDIYADGIKIKKDLSLIDKTQQDRILKDNEIPADDLYGNIWSNRYVNVYKSLDAVPDTFTVDLKNFTMPTMGRVTSNYGPRWRRMHYGVDLKVNIGDSIRSAFDGKVRVCQYEGRGYGYYVVVRHNNGLETVYGHLSEFTVSEDDVVKSGQVIGLGGNTGRSTGPHLHLETRFLGRPINPAHIIDFDSRVCNAKTYKVSTNLLNYSQSSRDLAYEKSKNLKGSNKYASAKYHRIQKGDTLASIARKYKTSISKLTALNNFSRSQSLRAGKSLRVL